MSEVTGGNEENRPDHEREAAEPFDGPLDPMRQLDEMAERPFRRDDEHGEQPDRIGEALEEDRAERRREQLLEGLNGGSRHDVLLDWRLRI